MTSEWKPIESAPKLELFEALIAFGRPLMVDKGTYIARKPGDGREGNGWSCWHGDVTAFYWRPLPLPPKPQEDAG